MRYLANKSGIPYLETSFQLIVVCRKDILQLGGFQTDCVSGVSSSIDVRFILKQLNLPLKVEIAISDLIDVTFMLFLEIDVKSLFSL